MEDAREDVAAEAITSQEKEDTVAVFVFSNTEGAEGLDLGMGLVGRFDDG